MTSFHSENLKLMSCLGLAEQSTNTQSNKLQGVPRNCFDFKKLALSGNSGNIENLKPPAPINSTLL